MLLSLLATTVLPITPLTSVAALTLPPHPQMLRHSSNTTDIPNPPHSRINTTSVVFPETQIRCSGAAFGWDLHFDACIDALNTRMGHDPRPFTFGYRGLPGAFHTLLPARLTSEENTADEGSMLEMYTAAVALTRKCAISPPGRRGREGWFWVSSESPDFELNALRIIEGNLAEAFPNNSRAPWAH
ncbi:hypothetical protein G7Y79_00032g066650 [Physcia stellaris]|nr:hypothetical protein G7Y79_00032g066650 [Physcia stellaris]